MILASDYDGARSATARLSKSHQVLAEFAG